MTTREASAMTDPVTSPSTRTSSKATATRSPSTRPSISTRLPAAYRSSVTTSSARIRTKSDWVRSAATGNASNSTHPTKPAKTSRLEGKDIARQLVHVHQHDYSQIDEQGHHRGDHCHDHEPGLSLFPSPGEDAELGDESRSERQTAH